MGRRVLPLVLAAAVLLLVAASTVGAGRLLPATTPQGAVQSLFDHVKARDIKSAFSYVASASKIRTLARPLLSLMRTGGAEAMKPNPLDSKSCACQLPDS